MAFNSCKKYPENTVWFKSIDPFFVGFLQLTKYSVNGIDSLSFLPSYCGSKAHDRNYKIWLFEGYSTAKKFSQNEAFFHLGSSANLIAIKQTYTNRKKNIIIQFQLNDTLIFHRNLFLNDEPWKIMKFLSTGTRKIEKTVNGNKYELQFESN